MKLGKLLFTASILFTFLAVNPSVWAKDSGHAKKTFPKDSLVTKLDSTIFLPEHLFQFSTLIPFESDETIKDRLSCIKSSIPLEYNSYVRGFIDYFTIRNRKYTRRMLERENLYFPLFEKYLAQYNMPPELKYLAVVESALNPKAKSVVGALGLWQFMPATGKDFRLVQNAYYDERMDPEKSTEAACKFLRSLHRMFGDWELALAAYNCGPGNVRKAITRSGGQRGFWAIFPYLPKETRGYVPSFTAVMYAMNYAEAHKITTDSLQYAVTTDTVLINQSLDLAKFSSELNVSFEDLKNLNPAIKKNHLPETVRNFAIKVPAEKRLVIAQNRSSILTNSRYAAPEPVIKEESVMVAKAEPVFLKDSASKNLTPEPYIVKRGEYLAKIAKDQNVSLADLKSWNNLKSNSVFVNQKLILYKPAAVTDSTSTALASAETKDSEVTPAETPVIKTSHVKKAYTKSSHKTMPKEKLIIHSVQAGDTLWNISRKYNGISVEEIKKRNKLKSNELKPGQKLVIS
jgi:membrane-bound lytic murein transglycosylase D